ncbi:hypothetical protein ABER23_07955 [Paenibacillus lautus]|uniref:hypothetical protein n=1 Tax=Paenibacillus lautus TaxID=1401 RepID=UPI003D29EDE4
MSMWQIRIYDMKHFWDKNYHLMELVKEVQDEPEFGSVFEINGKTYRSCASSPMNKVLGVQQITLNDDPEEQYDDDFKCPYCGETYDDAWELSADDGTIECSNCHSEIEYTREHTVTYSVNPVKMVEVVKL